MPLNSTESQSQVVTKAASTQAYAERKRSLLIGYYGALNLGDELMLECLHRWLTAQGLEVTVVCEVAEQVERFHKMAVVQNYPMLGQFSAIQSFIHGRSLSALKMVAGSDVVVAGGGDIIRDSIGWRTFSYQVEKLVTAVLLKKPVYLVNVGIADPVTKYGERVLRWLLPRCRKIIVRETRSLELCRRLGAGAITVLAPDIVLTLPSLFPTQRSFTARPYILVALRGNPNVYSEFELTPTRLNNLASALDSIIEVYHCDVKFLACQQGEGDADDHFLHRQILGLMRQQQHCEMLDWTIDPQQISNYFGQSKMVIAMRLHAAVLAAAFAKPCAVMSYDRKVEEFGKQAGMTHLLSAANFDSGVYVESVLGATFEETASAFHGPAEAERWEELRLF
jgi:polysaccharide pyruvyl transferase CsaB